MLPEVSVGDPTGLDLIVVSISFLVLSDALFPKLVPVSDIPCVESAPAEVLDPPLHAANKKEQLTTMRKSSFFIVKIF
jgi:hypothetical protein